MKKTLLAVLFAAVGTILFVGFGSISNAREMSFTERYLSDAENVATTMKSGTFDIDPNHSSVGFKVRHMGLAFVPGFFNKFTGAIMLDSEDVTNSSVDVSIDVASVDTRVEGRNKHLRSADFFDVEKFPTMTFKSKKVAKSGDKLKVTGDFTMKGVTKEVVMMVDLLPTKTVRGTEMLGAMGTTMIKRSEFGVNYGVENGMIGDDVEIEINVEAKAKSEQPKP
ncbi:MAG: YceI family protein [Pyrinomonadaceae bacterium]